MARTVTLLELRTWARELSDTENDPNITDPELTALANRHLCEVYDVLVDAGPPEYYSESVTVAVSANSTGEPLEADFRNLLDVYVHDSSGSGRKRRLQPMPHGALGRYQPPSAAVTLTVEYVPAAPVLEEDNDTFDGVSGWEELIANFMARDVLTKRKHDPSVVMANIGRLEQRIRSRARNRDKGSPKQITDLDEQQETHWWLITAKVQVYRLRGGNIEVYEPIAGYV